MLRSREATACSMTNVSIQQHIPRYTWEIEEIWKQLLVAPRGKYSKNKKLYIVHIHMWYYETTNHNRHWQNDCLQPVISGGANSSGKAAPLCCRHRGAQQGDDRWLLMTFQKWQHFFINQKRQAVQKHKKTATTPEC